MPYNPNQPGLLRLKKIYAERRRPFVFWVGAGLSRDAGMPTWEGLRDQLTAEALEKLVGMEPVEAAEKEAQLTTARNAGSLWDAFTTIKDILGLATYREAIRDRFENAPSVDIPEVYKAIWRLPNVTGLLNLNIDGLATRAHRRCRPDEDAVPFVGRDAADYIHLVAQRKPFIANLHGIHEAHSSWVFTRPEIKSLLRNKAYISFISFIFGNNSVIFAGISADDIAAGGILESLSSLGLDLGPHFWITDRSDFKTDAWANKAGLQIIRYEPEAGKDHTSVLTQLLAEIDAYKSFDTKAPVILPEHRDGKSLPSHKELLALDLDVLRMRLAEHAGEIISRNADTTSSTEYSEFLEQYSPAVHMAWHVTSNEPHNKFFDYTIKERIASGAFSSVWRATAPNGEDAALKIIQIDNLRDGPQIESFRRGVQSLRILRDSRVDGAAKFKTAFEIPTAVIMDFIEGENLQKISEQSKYKFWDSGIKILINLCRNLMSAHNLDEGVLHRDIRPSNIMVPYFYWGDSAVDAGHDPFEVVLLNYDMSWHKDAQGRTIAGSVQEAGFYAPEQLEYRDTELARSTKVDSYGVGMTLYFAATRQTPPIAGSRSQDWGGRLAAIRSEPSLKWRSAARRLRRLIQRATDVDQSDRPSIAEISAELSALLAAIEGKIETLAPDMWAEELFARAVGNEYDTSPDGSEFSQAIRAGRSVSLRGVLSRNVVQLTFRNQAIEGTDRSSIDKIWSKKLDTARDMLTSQGWEISDGTRYSLWEIHLIAEIHVSTLWAKFPVVVSGLVKALDTVRLD